MELHYYGWLGLNDEMINNNPAILQQVSQFLRKQDECNYFSHLANDIVNAHRNGKQGEPGYSNVALDPSIREINTGYVKSLDDEAQAMISAVEAFAQQYNNNSSRSRMRF